MDQENTDFLLKILKNADLPDLDTYCDDHPDVKKQLYRPFAQYMEQLITARGISRQQLIRKADFPVKFGYKLLSEEKKTRERDYVIRFCIALKLSLKEAQKALALYGFNPLYAKYKRDIVIITALNREIDDIDTVNDWLDKYHFPPLKRSGDDSI